MRIAAAFLFLLCLGSIAFAQDEMPMDDQAQPAEQQSTDHPTDQNVEQLGDKPAETKTSGVVAPPTTPAPIPVNATPAPPPSYEKKKYAVLQTLDKLTARTNTVTITVGQPTAVGPIFIDVKTCQKTPPSELPESAAFLQVWEAKPKSKAKNAKPDTAEESQWVFSGWMFASSPALSAMNHPVYDVWIKDCTNDIVAAKQK
jgi:hypothetical protein